MQTRQTHNAAGIIFDSETRSLLVLTGKNDKLKLPQHKFTLGEDPVKELKRELEQDYHLKLRFIRTVPDSWSRLVFLHNRTNKHFTVYYMYELLLNKLAQRLTGTLWLPIAELDTDQFSEDDASALEVAKELI